MPRAFICECGAAMNVNDYLAGVLVGIAMGFVLGELLNVTLIPWLGERVRPMVRRARIQRGRR